MACSNLERVENVQLEAILITESKFIIVYQFIVILFICSEKSVWHHEVFIQLPPPSGNTMYLVNFWLTIN
jgi:hypothetical protein